MHWKGEEGHGYHFAPLDHLVGATGGAADHQPTEPPQGRSHRANIRPDDQVLAYDMSSVSVCHTAR